MARRVTEDMISKWKELREKGYSFKEIGEKTGGWNETVVSRYLKETEAGQKEEAGTITKFDKNGELAAEAFKLFKRGVDPSNVVIELREPPERIKELYELWLGFPEIEDLRERNDYLIEENENLKKLVVDLKRQLTESQELLDFAVQKLAEFNQESKKKKTENDDIDMMISQIEKAHNNAVMMKIMKNIHGF